MKNTQKKLKAKHFRYLCREYVKDPNTFLDFFAGCAYSWDKYFYHLIVSCNQPTCNTQNLFDSGEALRSLGQAIECAYILMIKTKIQPVKQETIYVFDDDKDFSNYVYKGSINPGKLLSNFFSNKTLAEWYDVLDIILASFGSVKRLSSWDDPDKNVFEILALIEQLTFALYVIDYNGGVVYKLADDRPVEDRRAL